MYELNGLEPADGRPQSGEPSAPKFQPRVTAEMLNIFCSSYMNLAGEMPDPSAVRASLELVLRLKGARPIDFDPKDLGRLG